MDVDNQRIRKAFRGELVLENLVILERLLGQELPLEFCTGRWLQGILGYKEGWEDVCSTSGVQISGCVYHSMTGYSIIIYSG